MLSLPEVTGWANMPICAHWLDHSLDLTPRNIRHIYQQNDIALNEINIFDKWNIFTSLDLTQSLWSVTVVEIVQVKWSILIEFTFSTASVPNLRREIIRIRQHASCPAHHTVRGVSNLCDPTSLEQGDATCCKISCQITQGHKLSGAILTLGKQSNKPWFIFKNIQGKAVDEY